jgi:hypothetical protein
VGYGRAEPRLHGLDVAELQLLAPS